MGYGTVNHREYLILENKSGHLIFLWRHWICIEREYPSASPVPTSFDQLACYAEGSYLNTLRYFLPIHCRTGPGAWADWQCQFGSPEFLLKTSWRFFMADAFRVTKPLYWRTCRISLAPACQLITNLSSDFSLLALCPIKITVTAVTVIKTWRLPLQFEW